MSYPRRAKEGEECGWDSEVSEDESVARRSAEIRHGIRERLSVHASATDALCNRHMRVREGAIAGGDARIARTYVCVKVTSAGCSSPPYVGMPLVVGRHCCRNCACRVRRNGVPGTSAVLENVLHLKRKSTISTPECHTSYSHKRHYYPRTTPRHLQGPGKSASCPRTHRRVSPMTVTSTSTG